LGGRGTSSPLRKNQTSRGASGESWRGNKRFGRKLTPAQQAEKKRTSRLTSHEAIEKTLECANKNKARSEWKGSSEGLSRRAKTTDGGPGRSHIPEEEVRIGLHISRRGSGTKGEENHRVKNDRAEYSGQRVRQITKVTPRETNYTFHNKSIARFRKDGKPDEPFRVTQMKKTALKGDTVE